MRVAYWLLKTETDEYSFDDLERDGWAVWDGVTNNAALKHIRSVRKGDEALVYHTGDERQAVGLVASPLATCIPIPPPATRAWWRSTSCRCAASPAR